MLLLWFYLYSCAILYLNSRLAVCYVPHVRLNEFTDLGSENFWMGFNFDVKSFNRKKNGRYVHDCEFYELCVYPKLFFGKLKLIPMLDGYIKICSVYCNDNKIKNILINYKIFGNCNHINQISLRNCAVISVAPHFSTTSTSFWCTLYIFNTRLTSILITNQL